MLWRRLQGHGVPPLVLALIAILTFLILSQYLINKALYADYFYALLPVMIVSKLNDVKRSEFLTTCFTKKSYFLLRLLENNILSFPFICCLMFNNKYLAAIMLVFAVSLLSVLTLRKSLNYTFPTPFYLHPFEFLVGFRKSYLFVLMAYFLSIISITYCNFNLGIFSLVLTLLLCITYCLEPEPYIYVWNFSFSTKDFFIYKIKFLIIHTTVLSGPVLILLLLSFDAEYLTILVVEVIGYFLVATALLSKYARFPKKLNLIEIAAFMLSVIFLPLLVLVIPYFTHKAIKQINKILKC